MSERLSTDEVIEKLIAVTQEMADAAPTKYNRLFNEREILYATLEEWPNGSDVLEGLLEHSDAYVRLQVAKHCKAKKIILAEAIATLRSLTSAPGQIGREAKGSLEFELPTPDPNAPPIERRHPRFASTPTGVTKDAAAAAVAARFGGAKRAAVLAQLRPSIRLWPKPTQSERGSRFGGLPAVPAGWEWPFADEEPFIFMTQIDLADLGPLAHRHGLPDHGLLSFFGDPDEVQGCGESYGGAVYYFPQMAALRLAAPPPEANPPLRSCGIDFFETWELPFFWSDAFNAFAFDEGEREAYDVVLQALASSNGDEDIVTMIDISKFFGWPDIVQEDLINPFSDAAPRFFFQLSGWHDHDAFHWWGPGGTIYFQIREADLASRNFEAAEMEVQCT